MTQTLYAHMNKKNCGTYTQHTLKWDKILMHATARVSFEDRLSEISESEKINTIG
jgi:S-ribosylhomocysteine lyase LuxS involved in autoinducer biosynthesis